jgi:hypothetical protein
VAEIEKLGDPNAIASTRAFLAWVRYAQGDDQEAAVLLAAALPHLAAIGGVDLTDAFRLAACLAADRGDAAAAAALFGAAEGASKAQREWPYQTTERLITEPKVRAAARERFDLGRRRGQELEIVRAIELAQTAADPRGSPR